MLTNEAFNALLKTLEEPPPYAIFVLATTDVHKMLPTVLSRCQRFDFKRISTSQIVKHLLYVSEQENIKLERSAAELIARTAAGGMRDALACWIRQLPMRERKFAGTGAGHAWRGRSTRYLQAYQHVLRNAIVRPYCT